MVITLQGGEQAKGGGGFCGAGASVLASVCNGKKAVEYRVLNAGKGLIALVEGSAPFKGNIPKQVRFAAIDVGKDTVAIKK
jgi:hypothetical protein